MTQTIKLNPIPGVVFRVGGGGAIPGGAGQSCPTPLKSAKMVQMA